MALLHKAEIRPSKTELLTAWLPAQPWFRGEAGVEVVKVGAYRFDDPDGQVGIETLLVRAGDGPVLQVPLTYRGEPLDGGEAHLIGTMEHSVLGTRWVYDAVGDPVYTAVLARVLRDGGSEVEEQFEVDGVLVTRPNELHVSAPGGLSEADGATITVVRDVDAAQGGTPAAGTLRGSWPGRDDVLLATVRAR